MKPITPSKIRIRWDRRLFSFKLPKRYVILCIILLSFMVANLGMRTLGQFLPQPPNPFAAVADFFPGQPSRFLEAQGFQCTKSDYDYSDPSVSQSCSLWPGDGDFFRVQLDISQDMITVSEFQI